MHLTHLRQDLEYPQTSYFIDSLLLHLGVMDRTTSCFDRRCNPTNVRYYSAMESEVEPNLIDVPLGTPALSLALFTRSTLAGGPTIFIPCWWTTPTS